MVTAAIYPIIDHVYASTCYLSISYKSKTKAVKFQIFQLYSRPSAIYSDLITTSDFTALSDTWLPAHSKFKFSDNSYDANKRWKGNNEYGTLMFGEFE